MSDLLLLISLLLNSSQHPGGNAKAGDLRERQTPPGGQR